jgi:molybdopterin-synthase adenylyltransferase
MNDQQLLRYARHLLLDEIGIEGQTRLLNGHVLIIGAGGLGCAAAPYLASAGVGQLTLIDPDIVELSNLQRQILHYQDNIGLAKVESARQSLHQINPDIKIETIAQRADENLLSELLSDSKVDVILDCTDNFKTRHLINRVCVKTKIPLVSGSAIRFDGQLLVVNSSANSACYHCVFPETDLFQETQCANLGVFAPLVGIIGCMQASEAIKIMCGLPHLTNTLGMFNAITGVWSYLKLSRQSDCVACN